MALFRLNEPGTLDAPVVVAAFDGWVDAGAAGTAAAEQMAQGARTIATFDGDQLFDFRARRPTLDIVDGTPMGLEWPVLELRATRIGERDLLILSGPEPDYHWQEMGANLVELARTLEVASWISLGAIPAAVAHTRPVPVLGTASESGLLSPDVAKGPRGRLRVPSAALSVFELGISRAGIPAVGFFAQVPHYISAAYPTAAIELLRHAERHLGVEIPLGELPRRALETRAMLDAATANDERTKAYVEQLERSADEAGLPEGDELIADIERFLRERGGDGGGGTSGGENRLN
jgi:hypothetical protein